MREKGDGGGDFEFPPGGGSVSAASGAGGVGSSARCSSAPAGAPGGRFWALCGEEDGTCSSEGEGSDLTAGSAARELAGSEEWPPRRQRAVVRLGDFIERAEELGGSLRHRRRTAFAPGGRASRFRASSAPRFTRLGDDGARHGGWRGGGRRGASVAAGLWGGSAGSDWPPPSPEPPRASSCVRPSGEMGSHPLRAGDGPSVLLNGPGVGPAVVEVAHPLLLLGPPLGEFDGPRATPVRPVGLEGVQGVGPRWLWMPRGCTIPHLGFPARASEVERFQHSARTLHRIPEPPPLTRSFAEALMERYGGEGSGADGRNKRRYGDGEGRRQGAGRQDGGRLELGRQDGGRADLGRRDDGWREGGRRGRHDDEPRPRYGEQRASDQERGDWGPPPPWWEWEQQRLREEEANRARGQLPAANGGRGGGSGGGGGGGPPGRNKKGTGQGAPPNPKNKGKNKASAGGAAGALGGECFRCGREGHFQSECPNAPVCVLCSREGHASANCPTRGRPMLLQQMGHAITGGGFYNIEVEPLEGSNQEEVFEAVIHFDVAPLSALQLAEELKNLLDGSWDWRVAKVSEKEFSAFVHPRPGKAMPPVWVQLTGLPGDLMERERLMAALTMVGRPIDVDELSVKKWKTEPVRVRFQCRFPERIKGTIALCVNGEPYTVGVQAELGSAGAGGSNPPRPPPPGEDDDVDDLDSEDRSTDGERWNRHRKNDKAKAAAAPAGPGAGSGGGGTQRSVAAGSRSAPPLGRFEGQYGSNDRGCADVLGGNCGGVFGPEELSVASGETSSQVTDPVHSWLLDSPLKSGGLESGRAASKALPVLEVEMGDVEAGEATPKHQGQQPLADLRTAATATAPLAQGKRTRTEVLMAPIKAIKKKGPVGSVRKSARHGGAAASTAMEKAQKLAAERNLDPATGTNPDPDDFSILDARSDSQLGAVLKDSCILFVPSAGTPVEAISLLRAKEEAQAALARVAASQAKERAEREAREATLVTGSAAGEAASPGHRPGQHDREGETSLQVDGRPEVQPDSGSEDGAGEGPPCTTGRPSRRKGRRSTLTMRKGRGRRTVTK
ncbi:hypothetical protein QYE76_040105 [Lolium multiflorum]|uniref:CCHC-type domain-containing protein n=1 Tax=Lolium multiflorum TaxID=4521 RepID=A0AAD8TCC0_LOLMU|nr:hypothetical protein QYE76_040105 [Lolium multiflorum]